MTSIAYVSAPAPAGAKSGVLLLAALAAVMVAATILGSTVLWTHAHNYIMYVVAAQTAVYGFAVWLVVKARGGTLATMPRVVIMILAVGAIMRAVLVVAPPVSSDIYRYIWDGRTQANGINPYAYMPSDPTLKAQRDGEIYEHINRRDTIKTIYPPTAQVVFFAATRFGETLPVMKAFMMIFEALTMWALMRMMARRNLAPGRILLYAWNPLVIWELGGSGHTEVIGIAFMMLAMLAGETGRRFLSGMALAAGILSKYFPLAVAPAIYRRWDWRMPAGLLVGLGLLYLPYMSAGLGVFGSVDAYAKEEITDTSRAFFLLHWISQAVPVPAGWDKVYLVIGGALLLAGGLAVVMRRESNRVAPVAALVLMSAFQAVMSPHYTWYFTWAVPFLCFRVSPAVIWLTGTASLMYVFFTPAALAWMYLAIWGPFLVSAAIEFYVWRRGKSDSYGNAAVLQPRPLPIAAE